MVYVGLIEGECFYCEYNMFVGYGDKSYWDYLPLEEALTKYKGYDIKEL